MDETITTPTVTESSFLNDMLDAILIAFGFAETGKVVEAKHVRYGMIISAVIAWVGGIYRKTSKPSVGPLGF